MPSISALEIHVGSFTLEIQQSILVWLILCVVFATFFIVAGKKNSRDKIHRKPVRELFILVKKH